MANGFYTAAQAMLLTQRRLNSLANNVANINTTGYKRSDVIQSSFQDQLSYRIDQMGSQELGSIQRLVGIDSINTVFDQANLEATDRKLDLSIASDGFFTIRTNNGLMYTRDGHFNIDTEGYLITGNGGRVQGINGDIRLTSEEISVDQQGWVRNEQNQIVSRLDIRSTEDITSLQRMNDGTYRDQNQVLRPVDAYVVQGMLEHSNVDVNQEMTRLMEVQRNFQSVANALKLIDRLNERAVNEIGKV